jgi:hypothetical protein
MSASQPTVKNVPVVLLILPTILALLIALFTSDAAVHAQQDGDVTVIIKAKSKPSALPTLLVICDLVCSWKLDGEVKGHINAGGSVKVKVEPGQHMVEATTEDGVDQVKQPSTVKPTGQTMVNIELKPIRDARLIAEQGATDNAEEMARSMDAQKAREQAEREARDKDAREEAAGFWTDPETGLMWAKADSSKRMSAGDSTGLLKWEEAAGYCRNLQLDDHKDWKLPTIDELEAIYEFKIFDPKLDKPGVKGNLRILFPHWSSTPSKYPGVILTFDFYHSGMRGDKYANETAYALCVRHSTE